MDIVEESKVGAVASRVPGAWKVFHRYGIDYCCRGAVALSEACRERGMDVGVVLRDLRKAAEDRVDVDEGTRWGGVALSALIDHIVEHYHARHREELPLLEAMADKVSRVHGGRDARLTGLRDEVFALGAELSSHMMKEERVLFPWIREGNGAMAGEPVRVMMMEHDTAGRALDRIIALTDEFTPPAGACGTWRALYSGLRDLDAGLRMHIHLENNVLFPAALQAREVA